MNTTFKVQWQPLFKKLAILTPVLIFFGILISMGGDLVLQQFGLAKPFKHTSLPSFLGMLFGATLLGIPLAFLFAQWFRRYTITFSEDAIEDRNLLGRKKKIPLADITKLTPYSDNGIDAIVVHSRYHGQVYILEKTERLGELLDILESYLPHEAER